MLVPHLGRTTPASRRPHPQRTLHKDRKGGDLFLFTHLTVERCPFLFNYLFRESTVHRALIRFLCYGVQEAGEFLLPGVVHLALLLLAQPQAKSESTAG